MSSTSLYITYLGKEGPFLKIWGQLDKNTPIAIDKALADATVAFTNGHHIPPSIQYFSVGHLCCAKFSDDAYYRAKFTNVDSLNKGYVEVLFIDYGNTDIVQCKNVRTMAPFSREFITIGPQAREFYLMNVTHNGTDWDPVVLEQIMQMIRYVDVAVADVIQIGSCYLIKLIQNGQELSSIIKNAGHAVDVPTHIQQTLIQKNLIQKMQEPQLRQPRSSNQQLASPSATSSPHIQHQPVSPHESARQQLTRPTILTFKSTPLEPNSEHEIYVSYVTDGPLLFSIQLKKTEENLRALMNEINDVPLQPFTDTPTPSTMCLAQSSEDGYICRAVVTNMVDGEYKIYYVDFGNTEMRSIDYIFEIPYKFIIPKLMATRFALDGFDKAVVTVHMKVVFKEFVENRLLNIRVKSRCVRTGLPLCDIWDEKGVQAIDVVKQAATDAYADPVQVSKGSAQPVRVSSVYSCNRFYIQLKAKDDELQSMTSFMDESCPSRKPLEANEVFQGKPCATQLGNNGKWHRAIITEAFTNGTVKIFLVDLGVEDTLHSRNLKQANYDQITKLRPQALQCSLNGYQNMPPDKERDTFLKEILLNQEFTAKVVDLLGSVMLVDMIDAKNYNVGSLLIEKLASSRSQISPLLIQDSNKIEFKKRSPQALYENKPYNRDQNSSFKLRESNDNKLDRQRNQNRDEGFMSRNRNTDDSNRDRNDGFNKNRDGGSRSGNRDGGYTGNYQKKKFGSGTDSGSEKDNSPDKTKTFGRPNKSNDKVNNHGDFNANKFSRNHSRDGTPPTGRPNKISFKGSDSSENCDETNLKARNANQVVRRERQDGESDSTKGTYAQNLKSPPKNENNPVLANVDVQFQTQVLAKNTKNVGICWFHNPGNFFVQLEDYKSDLKFMMNFIQSSYKRRRTITPVVNQAVIAQYPADNAYYRAIVLYVRPGKYRVQYVDFGNISGATNIFAIEEQHMALPAQAVRCQLSGIKPVKTVWAKANLMQKHFDVDICTCEFVGQVEDRFDVILTKNNKNIADLLIADNLATALITLDLPILLWQEIKVLVNTVSSLSDFIIEVKSDVKVQCTLHNLADATETFEEILKELVGYYVIAYFDKIEGTRAEVTLYNTFGMKLALIKPDEGALDSISPLCAMPVFLSTVEGFVTHATDTTVFIQPNIYTPYATQLLNDMLIVYNGVKVRELVLPQKGIEYAVLATDENWYRGNTISVEGDMVTIHYIDYGNDEIVNKKSLRILQGTLYDPHELCIEIRMNENNVALIDTEIAVNIAYGDNGWTKVEKEPKSEVIEVKTKVMEPEKENETPVKAKSREETSLKVKSEVLTSLKEQTTSTEEIVPDGAATDTTNESYGMPIAVSHIDTPNMFYVQLAQDLEAIDALQVNILAQIDTLMDAKEPIVGMLCAALYNENNEWYRAEVLAIKEHKITVRFVDYGNCDDIDSTQTKLKLLPADTESLERYARPCSLYITPVESKTNDWSPEACARFEELAYVEDNYAEIIQQDEDITFIHIYHNDSNLAQVLVKEKYALKMADESFAVDSTEHAPEPPTESISFATTVDRTPSTEPGIAVLISHIDSPGQFYVQLSSDLDAIDALQAKLQSQVTQLADVEAASAGVLCAAIYSANQEWYRAHVLDTDVDITTVRFVDYGNTDVLDNSQTKVKSLTPELLTLEQYARRCSLYVTPSIESSDWSQEACARFEELTYFDDVRAEIIEQDDKTTYVNLFANKINVGDVLISEKLGQPIHFETEATYPTGFISHVNSPSEFWIQLENACGDLERIADQLERDAGNFGTLNDMSPGTLCAAVFPDDEKWYRARILSNTVAGLEVLFIDYGNSCTCTNLRELPEDLVMTPALAQKCCLQKPNGVLQWSPAATDTFKEIAADGRTIFVVHNLVPGETTIVQLYLDDQDITQHLLPITTAGYVSHIDKLDSIWIRKTTNLPKLEKWTVLLPNAKNWSKANEIDQIVAAYMEEDATWYRAKVTEKIDGKEEYKVLLIDFGINAVSKDIRTWPEDCLDECEPLATKYKLQPLPGFKWTTESETQFKNINNSGKTIFHVEYVSEDVVQLYCEMQDVRRCLDSIKSTPIASLQNTPSKKSEHNHKMNVFHGGEEENLIVELKNNGVKTDTVPEDIATTTSDVSEIIYELVQNSVKSPESILINKSLPDTLNPVKVVLEDVKVSIKVTVSKVNKDNNEFVQNSVERPEKIFSSHSKTVEIINDSDTSNSAVRGILNDIIKDSVKSREKTMPTDSRTIKMIDKEASNHAMERIVNELIDNSVKTPEKCLPDNSASFPIFNNDHSTDSTCLSDAKEILNELVQNSVKSSTKQIFDETATLNNVIKNSVSTRFPVVTDILEDIVRNSVDISKENIVASGDYTSKIFAIDTERINISGFVEEIVDNSTKTTRTLDVENMNNEVTAKMCDEVTLKNESVIATNAEKSALSIVDIENKALDDSLKLATNEFISAKGDSKDAITVIENDDLNRELSAVQNADDLAEDAVGIPTIRHDLKAMSSDIINSIVDGLE